MNETPLSLSLSCRAAVLFIIAIGGLNLYSTQASAGRNWSAYKCACNRWEALSEQCQQENLDIQAKIDKAYSAWKAAEAAGDRSRARKKKNEHDYWTGYLASKQVSDRRKIDREFNRCQKEGFGGCTADNDETEKDKKQDKKKVASSEQKDKNQDSNGNSSGSNDQNTKGNSNSSISGGSKSNGGSDGNVALGNGGSGAITSGGGSAFIKTPSQESNNQNTLPGTFSSENGESGSYSATEVNAGYMGREFQKTDPLKPSEEQGYYKLAELRRKKLNSTLSAEESAELERLEEEEAKTRTASKGQQGNKPPSINYVIASPAPLRESENLLASIQQSAAILSQGSSLAGKSQNTEAYYDSLLNGGSATDDTFNSAKGRESQGKLHWSQIESDPSSALKAGMAAGVRGGAQDFKQESKHSSFSIGSIANSGHANTRRIAGTAHAKATGDAAGSNGKGSSVSERTRPKWLNYLPKFISESSILTMIFPSSRKPAADQPNSESVQIAGMHTDLFYNINRAYQFAGGSLNK